MGALSELLKKQGKAIVDEATQQAALHAKWVTAVNELLDQMEKWLREADPHNLLRFERTARKRYFGSDDTGFYVRQEPAGLRIALGDRYIEVVPAGRSGGGPIDIAGEDKPARTSGRVDFSDGAMPVQSAYLVQRGNGDEWYVGGVLSPARRLDRGEFEAVIAGQLG